MIEWLPPRRKDYYIQETKNMLDRWDAYESIECLDFGDDCDYQTYYMEDMRMNEIQALLNAWDAGEEISTVEMGGFGGEYEQAIQYAVMEFLRGGAGRPFGSIKKFRKSCSKLLSKFNESLGFLTGSQYIAAVSLRIG